MDYNFFNNVIDNIFNKSKRFHAEKNKIYVMIWFKKRRKSRTLKINLNVIFIKFNVIMFCNCRSIYANAKKVKSTFINKNNAIFNTRDVVQKRMYLFFKNYSVAIIMQFSNTFLQIKSKNWITTTKLIVIVIRLKSFAALIEITFS